MNIDFWQAIKGTQARVNITRYDICDTCRGSGSTGAGHLADVSRTFALLAGGFAGAGGTGAVASIADFVARDIDALLGAFNGLPEIDIH